MNSGATLSAFARRLMGVTTAAFGLVGMILFVAPGWSAAHFAWKISPMVAMTMGGWYLGSAAMAGLVTARGRWNVVYASMLYVGVFGATEAAVLVVHYAKLKLDALLAWPYMGMLALAIVSSLFALFEWMRRQPGQWYRTGVVEEGRSAPGWVRLVVGAFILFVFFLAGVAFSGHRAGVNGLIFPEPLSLFTLHSFGAFYFSLAFSALAFLRVRRLAAVTVHVLGGLALIVLITVAALVYIRSFNFSAHPFQSLYLGVYLGVLFLALFYLWRERARPRDLPRGG